MNLRTRASAAQPDPLLPGYSFDLYLVAGLTRIERGGALDFFIDRPQGMKGYILNLTVEGCGMVRDGDHTFECHPGDVLLFPPDVAHDYGRAEAHERWIHRWVYFRPRGFWAPWLAWQSKTADAAGRVSRIQLPMGTRQQEVDTLFQHIDATHREGRSTSEELAINLLERLLILCYEETPAFLGKPLDPRVQAACQFIVLHLEEDMSLERIARHVCLSPSRLAHLFRDHTGVNIVRWREDQRITLAKYLLQGPGTPIATIAARVGYEDHLYFSRVFRKRVGVCPSDYRHACAQSREPR